MKKLLLAVTIAVSMFFIVSCDDKNNKEQPTFDTYVDATNGVWNYYSLAENKLVGTGADSVNAEWFAKSSWDIAIKKYEVRTNSGASTSISSKGGVYTFSESADYDATKEMVSDSKFTEDVAVTAEGMGGVTTTIKSTAQVIQFAKNEDGSMIMPPTYLQSPLYAFRSADGNGVYKLLFTQYQDDKKVTGHVKFKFAKIN